jgi:hypothetical protein
VEELKPVQLDFTYRESLSLDGAVEHLLDDICERYDCNIKSDEVTNFINETYISLTVILDNYVELDCEIGWNDEADEYKKWEATVLVVSE